MIKTPRTNVRKLILTGIKDYCNVFAPSRYSYTAPASALIDWLFTEGDLTPRQRYYADKAIKDLLKIKLILGDEQTGYKLTEKGECALGRMELNDFAISKPAKWDGKYRVITFDIAESRRKTRNEVRSWLLRLGFIRLQDSVWVFPYECQDIVCLIKTNYEVVREVIYMTVESIENDLWLKNEFGLT